MANEEQLKFLKQGVEVWNKWRHENPEIRPDLLGANLTGSDLMVADIIHAKPWRATLTRAELSGVNLSDANLRQADLSGANLRQTDLSSADLTGADFRDADLTGVDLRNADLRGVDLSGADLTGADLKGADFVIADLTGTSLVGADLSGAGLSGADLKGTHLVIADLSGADLIGADLSGADLRGASLEKAKFDNTVFDGETKGLEELTEEQRAGLVFDEKKDGLEVDEASLMPHRMVSFAAMVGPEAVLNSVYLPFSRYVNQVPSFDAVLAATQLSDPDVLHPRADEEEFRAFVENALRRLAGNADLPEGEAVVANSLAVLDETMAGIMQSPLQGWSLSDVAKLKSGAAVGGAAWLSGEPMIFFACVLGGILVIDLVRPLVKGAGEGARARMRSAIEDADLIEMWRRINAKLNPPDDEG
jgi:uncharacterized protein YjbI with pentapeptide repeats